jgi:hypothetical protein
LSDVLRKRYQTNIEVGDLVGYETSAISEVDSWLKIQPLGIVIRLTEISPNSYEKGFLEAKVHWNIQPSKPPRHNYVKNESLFQTYENVNRLKKLA